MKSISHIFKGLSAAKNYLGPESAPLTFTKKKKKESDTRPGISIWSISDLFPRPRSSESTASNVE